MPASLQEILFNEDVIDESEHVEDYDFGEDESDSDSERILEENCQVDKISTLTLGSIKC